MAFRAGDHVSHGPSGERWVLACDQHDADVIPAGWPESLAKAADCRLLRAATDAERLDMLRTVAEGRSPGYSYRRSVATQQLQALREALGSCAGG